MKYQVLLKDPPRSTGYFVDIILKIGPTTRLWVKYLLSDPPLPNPILISDLGTISVDATRRFSDSNNRWLLRNCYRPGSDVVFPKKIESVKSRSFQYAWIREYNWLSYSEVSDEGYYVACILFNRRSHNYGQLVNSPMVSFPRAKQTLREHNCQVNHSPAVEGMTILLDQMESGRLSVEQRLQSHAANTIKKNRQIIMSIVKCILFCGRRNISFLGHRSESGPYSGDNTLLHQVILAFPISFAVSHGCLDVLLQDHFSNADKYAHYRSPTNQNDLIATCRQ